MDTMEDFEGVKRIVNKNSLTIEDIFSMLKTYREAIGELILTENKDRVIADTEGKYYIDISLRDKYILIQRRLEKGSEDDNYEIGTGIKSIDMSVADRMIEQIYDFILDFINNDGNVSEFITCVKKVLYVKQEEERFSNVFNVYDEDLKLLYEMKDNKFTKEFGVKNLVAKREEVSVKYADIKNNRFSILKAPYTTIYLMKNTFENKTTFSGTINSKEIKIKADYSDNHYLIEVNEIVIGAIDSLNENTKDSYRLEVNDLSYEYLILAFTIIIDLYAKKVDEEEAKNNN